MDFEKWMDAVDADFVKVTGFDRDSWPDQDYWSMFDDEMTPREAVIAAIENEYGEAGLEAFGFEVN